MDSETRSDHEQHAPQPVADVEIHTPDALAAASGPAPDTDGLVNGGARDLAKAFQANAEALRGLHEIHADLSASLKRGDRSELVLQSTQALNQTFRNLTSVQRELLGRMDDLNKAANRSPVVPFLILGMLVVLLGGIYVIVDVIQSGQPTMTELAELKAENARGRLEAFKEGQDTGSQELQTALTRLEGDLAKADARLVIAQTDRDETRDEVQRLERTQHSLETERDELAERALRSQNELMARTLVEDELRGVKGDLAVATRRLDQAEADLDDERAEGSRLRSRLAAFGWGLPEEESMFRVSRDRDMDSSDGLDPDAPESDVPDSEAIDSDDDSAGDGLGAPPAGAAKPTPSGPGPVDPWQPTAMTTPRPAPTTRTPDTYPGDQRPPPPPPPPPIAASPTGVPAPVPVDTPEAGAAVTAPDLRRKADLERNGDISSRIRQRVNRLLDAGRSGSQTSWKVSKIGGYTRDLLGEVVLLEFDAQDRVVGNVQADEVLIQYDAERDTVELIAKHGRHVRGQTPTPLPGDGLRIEVGRGAGMVRMWRSSGLVMLKKR